MSDFYIFSHFWQRKWLWKLKKRVLTPSFSHLTFSSQMGTLSKTVQTTHSNISASLQKKCPTLPLSVFNDIYEVFPYLVQSPAFLTRLPEEGFGGGHWSHLSGNWFYPRQFGALCTFIAPSERKLRLSWRFFENLCLFSQEMSKNLPHT